MNLKNTCIINITNQIRCLPELMQEELLNTSENLLKKQIKKEIEEDVVKEKESAIKEETRNEVKELYNLELVNLVPDIMSLLLKSNYEEEEYIEDYIHSLYDYYDYDIVQTAINISRNIVDNFGQTL